MLSTPWRMSLGRLAVPPVTSGVPGAAWERCRWGWTCSVVYAGACRASLLRPRWSFAARPLLSLPHQLLRRRDRLGRLPPGTRVHPCRAPLPLSHRARAPRRSPLACPRARHTYRPARCALGCRPCAGSWGRRGRRHPDAPHAPSSGRTERAPRWGTAPPVSAAWCDTASCGVTRSPRRTGQGPSGAHHAWWARLGEVCGGPLEPPPVLARRRVPPPPRPRPHDAGQGGAMTAPGRP